MDFVYMKKWIIHCCILQLVFFQPPWYDDRLDGEKQPQSFISVVTLWFTKGNYTSAPLHGHATFQMSVTGEKIWISFLKIILFKDHTQTPKPNVCSFQKHPIKHADFFFFWAGVYIAWKTMSAKPHAHFYHHVVQFLCWVTAPCTLPSIKSSFHSPCACLERKRHQRNKKGRLFTAAKTERGKAVENYQPNKSFTRKRRT